MKLSTLFKHFAECFLENCTFIFNVSVFLNHCDVKWLYFPCPSVAAIIFTFTFYCTDRRGQLLKFLHVLSCSSCWCAVGFLFLLTFLFNILHLHDDVKSNVFSGKCYNSRGSLYSLHHTIEHVYCLYFIHCIHPLCLFAWIYFWCPTFLSLY